MSFSHIHIAYGSESGRAEQLAFQLNQYSFLANFSTSLATLNQTDLSLLGENDLLLIITSSFGDGEPPENATEFAQQLENLTTCSFHYAVFGLGDITYDKFCGYSKLLDDLLKQKKAFPLIEKVDADLNYQETFRHWLFILEKSIVEKPDETVQHSLSVQVYNENIPYSATLLEIAHLANSNPKVYHLRLSLENSGILYQAGDLVYIQPKHSDLLLAEYVQLFGEQASEYLAKKELRLLSKNVLRDIAKITGNSKLKDLLKISNKKELEQYLYGRDLLDVLIDFDTERKITLMELTELLPNLAPRAYSISSCGKTNPDYVDLCVREVGYQLNSRNYRGTASSYLADSNIDDQLSIFVKSSPNFHLPEKNAPIVMIGSGTGIAPYIGFLQAIENESRVNEHYLFFGERYRSQDFLYQHKLESYLKKGTLTQLFTAFSRDQAEKIYVQDILKEQAELIWRLIQQGAYFYVCGSKKMGKAIDDVLLAIAENIGNEPYVDAFNNIVAKLVAEGRLLKDVY
ncbi:diflavin oxidoreductase [Ursidibacter arcticus]